MNDVINQKILNESERLLKLKYPTFDLLEKEERYKSRFEPISLKSLMSTKFPETKWLINSLVPVGTVTALSGQPSTNKTWIALDIAKEVAIGGKVFGHFETSQTGVLLIDEETGDRWLQERFSVMSYIETSPIYLLCKSGFKLSKANVNQAIDFCKSKDIGLVIFDSFLRVHNAKDENSSVEMAQVFSYLQDFTREDISAIFIHHHRKQGLLRSKNPSQELRGSSDILASADSHLAIERKKDNTLVVRQTKLRQGKEVLPFSLEVINEEDEFRLSYLGAIEEEKSKTEMVKDAIRDILNQSKEPMYKKELSESIKSTGLDFGYTTFKNAIKELVDGGELIEKKGYKNKVFCSLNKSEKVTSLFDKQDSQNSPTYIGR